MTRAYTFDNAAEALQRLSLIVVTDGAKVSPRDQKTRELRDVIIQIDNPTDPNMLSMNRKWNPEIAIAEFLQLVGGFSDPERMKKIAPTFKNFLNGGAFHGAYGPRTSMQFENLIRKLHNDPYTRQGVVQIWDPLHDQQRDRLDVPCTLGFVFSIRNAELHMSTHMRSNDLWWGWSYDAFQFMQLQCTIANVLQLTPGPYVHYVNSLHLYERDIEKALSLTQRDPLQNIRIDGIGRVADDWAEVQREALSYFYGPYQALLSDGEAWMQSKMKKYWNE